MIAPRVFREGTCIRGWFGGVVRAARVERASQWGEALTFVDAAGREITEPLESFATLSPAEADEAGL